MPEQTLIGFTLSFTDPLGKLNTEEAFHTNKNNNWKSKYNRYQEKYTNAAGDYFKVTDDLYIKSDDTILAGNGYRLVRAPAYGLNSFNNQAYMISRNDIEELVGYPYPDYNDMRKDQKSEWERYELNTGGTIGNTENLWRLEYFVGSNKSAGTMFEYNDNNYDYWPGLGEYGANFLNEDVYTIIEGSTGRKYRFGRTETKLDHLNLYGYD